MKRRIIALLLIFALTFSAFLASASASGSSENYTSTFTIHTPPLRGSVRSFSKTNIVLSCSNAYYQAGSGCVKTNDDPATYTVQLYKGTSNTNENSYKGSHTFSISTSAYYYCYADVNPNGPASFWFKFTGNNYQCTNTTTGAISNGYIRGATLMYSYD